MNTEERLEMLEKELARAKRRSVVAIALAGLLLAAACLGNGNNPKDVIRAKEFALEDENGHIRGRLTLMKGAPGLSLNDENGTLRAGLVLVETGAGLSLYNESGKPQATLGITELGAGLLLSDANGVERIALAVPEAGPAIILFDETGIGRAELAVQNSPCLQFGRGDGQVFWRVP